MHRSLKNTRFESVNAASMSTFEYIASIYSIVLGLAVANVLSAIVWTLKYRDSIRLNWIHSAWCAYLLFALIATWWGLWQTLSDIQTSGLFEFLIVFQLTVFLYLASSLLRPDPDREIGNDLVAYFEKIRVPFLLCLILPLAIFVPASYLVFDYFDPIFLLTEGLLIILGVVGLIFAARSVQAFVVCAWLTILVTQESLQAAGGG